MGSILLFFFSKSTGILFEIQFLGLAMKSFNSQTIPSPINDTLLWLIHKFKNANQLKNFRPIGLCNTIYKIITKVISNRIKPFLDKLIGPQKLHLLKRRRTCDNAILIQEIFRHLHKIKSSKGSRILKIDLKRPLISSNSPLYIGIFFSLNYL